MRNEPKLAFSPTRLQHNDDPILSLGIQTNYTLQLFIIFSLLCSQYVVDLIKKQELRLTVASVLFKTKFGYAQIRVPKIGILMSKTACINPWYIIKGLPNTIQGKVL